MDRHDLDPIRSDSLTDDPEALLDLAALLDGTLASDRRDAVAERLLREPDPARLVAAIPDAASVSAEDGPGPEQVAAIRAAVRAELEPEHPVIGVIHPWLAGFRWAAAAAVLVLACLIGYRVGSSTSMPATPASPTISFAHAVSFGALNGAATGLDEDDDAVWALALEGDQP